MTTYCEPYYTTDYYTTVSDFFIEVGSSEQGMFINTSPVIRVRSTEIESSQMGQFISELLNETFKILIIEDIAQVQGSPAVSFSMEAGVSVGSVLQAIILKQAKVGGTEPIDIFSMFQGQDSFEMSLSGTWGISKENISQGQITGEQSFGKIINTVVEALFQNQQTVELLFGRESGITILPVSQDQTAIECEVELYGRCFTISISADTPIVAVGKYYYTVNESISTYHPINETITTRVA